MVTLPRALALIGIAALDSLNPSLFVAQFYLLTTPNPIPRIVAYIAGVLAANFGGGLLILAGFRSVAARWLDAIPAAVVDGLLLTTGVALLGFGLWYRAPAAHTPARTPRSLRPLHLRAGDRGYGRQADHRPPTSSRSSGSPRPGWTARAACSPSACTTWCSRCR